eukprot:959284-Rhodomonas_salina.1
MDLVAGPGAFQREGRRDRRGTDLFFDLEIRGIRATRAVWPLYTQRIEPCGSARNQWPFAAEGLST